MPADEFAVACLMVIELKSGDAGDQRLQKRLALDERQTGGVSAVKMQKIEGVVDEAHSALAVARRLGLRKAGQPIVANSAQFAVEVSGLGLRPSREPQGHSDICRSSRARSESAIAPARRQCARTCESRRA